MEASKTQSQPTLQVRVGTAKGLTPETYRAMRIAAVDERKTLGELIEESWAARLLQRESGTSVRTGV